MAISHRTLTVLVPAVAVLMTVACGSTSAPPAVTSGDRQLERPFEPGGEIQLHLSAGEYSVQGSPDNRITVVAEAKNPADQRRVRLSAETKGTQAIIRTDGPSNGFRVGITVPSRAALMVRLTAGDLTISGIEGHKDVSAWAGDMKIGVSRPEDYRSVNASVTAGDLRAAPFNRSTGGLFRFLSWQGPGRYDLTARLTAGDLTLRPEK